MPKKIKDWCPPSSGERLGAGEVMYQHRRTVVGWALALPKEKREELSRWLSSMPTTDLTLVMFHHAIAGKYPGNVRAVGVDPQTPIEGETLTFTGIDDLPSLSLTQRQIMQVCADIEKLLIAKNRKYGDSALHPKRVFSKADAIEQIKVRIDDKLSRIESAQSDEDEDVLGDLIGYLVLLKVAMMRQGAKGQVTRERPMKRLERLDNMIAKFDELRRRFDITRRKPGARPSDQPEGKRKGR